MNHSQIVDRVHDLQQQLSQLGKLFRSIQCHADEAFDDVNDEWPDTLSADIHVFERRLRKFLETWHDDDFQDEVVAGKPAIAELLVEAETARISARNAFRGVYDALGHDSPSSGYSTWHWFENALQRFLKANLGCLSTIKQALQDEEASTIQPTQTLSYKVLGNESS